MHIHIMKQLEQSNIYTILKAQSTWSFNGQMYLEKKERQVETKGIFFDVALHTDTD